jgi:ABC-type multidrug transport system ATPase subunit
VANEPVLQIDHLKKHFKKIHAVEDLSFSISRGEVFGFLGPNGAGKTTTIGMILGLIYPTAGQVKVFGQEVTPMRTRVLSKVGALVESPALVPYLSAQANLALLARLYPNLPQGRIAEVLGLVGLGEVGKQPARQFSLGMKQRLGLALALLSQPELLILDEPTNGLDPAGMHEIRLLIRSLADQGMTVLLSSHLLHEMELICERVAIIQNGRLLAQGKIADLLGHAHESVHIVTQESERAAEILREIVEDSAIRAESDHIEVEGISSEAAMYQLVHHGLIPREVRVVHPDLESAFLELTNQAR